MHKIKDIIIDPRFMINYSSYYIQGLNKYSFKIINEITIDNFEDYRKGTPFKIRTHNNQIFKIFIDTWDKNDINNKYYEWSDVYAKINLTETDAIKYPKTIAIGPSFGVKLWCPIFTAYKGIKNYLFNTKTNDSFKWTFKIFFSNYCYSFIRRFKYEKYLSEYEEDREYVFTMNTLWYDKLTHKTTNHLRGVYALTCKERMKYFEGGFFYIGDHISKEFPEYLENLTKYKDIIINRRIPFSEYLDKTKKSSFVFNTPSVAGCHGWKLGEYLAMGKAIISTPLNNLMPGKFENGTHYIEVKNDEEIKSAIDMLHNNEELREKLKNNAKDYFNKYLSPQAVWGRIIDKALNK